MSGLVEEMRPTGRGGRNQVNKSWGKFQAEGIVYRVSEAVKIIECLPN